LGTLPPIAFCNLNMVGVDVIAVMLRVRIVMMVMIAIFLEILTKITNLLLVVAEMEEIPTKTTNLLMVVEEMGEEIPTKIINLLMVVEEMGEEIPTKPVKEVLEVLDTKSLLYTAEILPLKHILLPTTQKISQEASLLMLVHLTPTVGTLPSQHLL